ncbi:acetyl-CoA carboxylase biotin carboxyl carrier protein subunit [Gracilibacillus halophilus YIM-C55.5]|uniref:Biotin carboxyl carrier protein of acetyl-CoA carboxylase n=1 Tax=Gracilibacillus halophilus YIM-C55.5 TaxID=1308866 RepID=N4WDW1_9BACI|nr:acetyl-CoA carboxylase biotin carboxyl carrier protein [Gracilibacillus halophilus]ENH97434.1 acetyl-CoA carboxylase biotin carboxyl carrier protein subunit [Gracilibacillus halophilus YIM-C55.5]
MLSLQEIEQLIDRLDQSSVDELSYEANGTKLSLKKNNAVATAAQPVQQVPVQTTHETNPPQVKTPEPVEEKETNNTADTSTPADYDHEIVSPMVGTFYSSPSPDKPAFIQAGDDVSEDSVVCIVEAMKLFNEIEAEVKGKVTEVLVENGELVEYGQPLFRIKTA